MSSVKDQIVESYQRAAKRSPHPYINCEVCGMPGKEGIACSHCPSKLTEGLKFDTGKLRYSLVPPVAIKGIAEVLTFGASKYGANNWQLVEDAEVRYLDALMRHLEAYRAGERFDPESGLPHLAHLATNVAFLQYFDDKKTISKEDLDGICTNSF